MISSLRIKGYRCHRDLTVKGLTRVNLIIGENNSGKTSLLEAAAFATSRADLATLLESAHRRGEIFPAIDGGMSLNSPRIADARQLFYGRTVALHSNFRVEATDESLSGQLLVAAGEIEEAEEHALKSGRVATSPAFPGLGIPAFMYGMPHESAHAAIGNMARLVDGYGLEIPHQLPLGVRLSRHNANDPSLAEWFPTTVIPTESVSPHDLADWWGILLTTSTEKEVTTALRIMVPDAIDVAFQPLPLHPRAVGGAGVLVKVPLNDPKGDVTDIRFEGNLAAQRRIPRVPLGSLGDGTRRILTLACGLLVTENGYLFVDEVDTGIHYSAMTQMWEVIVETAVRHNVQVFATSHSGDCLRGLEDLCAYRPDLQSEVSTHKLVPGLEESIRVDAEQLLVARRSEVEIR